MKWAYWQLVIGAYIILFGLGFIMGWPMRLFTDLVLALIIAFVIAALQEGFGSNKKQTDRNPN
jgi:hypothetical protein